MQQVKDANEETSNYVRTYCLQNLAELRGALPDSAFPARKGRSLPVASYIRVMLHIPKPMERNMIGVAVTATRQPLVYVCATKGVPNEDRMTDLARATL